MSKPLHRPVGRGGGELGKHGKRPKKNAIHPTDNPAGDGPAESPADEGCWVGCKRAAGVFDEYVRSPVTFAPPLNSFAHISSQAGSLF